MKKLIVITLLLLPSLAWGAVYYADNSLGSNCTGNYSIANRACTGSDGNAYKTLKGAVAVATTAGDTVYVRTGDYSAEGRIDSAASGSAGSLVTIQNYNSEVVTISRIQITHDYNKFSGFKTNFNATTSGVVFVSGNNNTVSYFTVENGFAGTGGATAVGITGNYNTLSYCTIQGTVVSAAQVGTHTGDGGDCTDACATLVDTSQAWTVNEWAGKKIVISNQGSAAATIDSNTATTVTATISGKSWNIGDNYVIGDSWLKVINITGSNNTITRNTIQNLGGTERVYTPSGSNNTISYNEIRRHYHKARTPTDPIHPDIMQIDSCAATVSGLLIEGEYWHDLQGMTLGQSPSAGWVMSRLTDMTIRNCVAANIELRSSWKFDSSKWYNNTFYNVETRTEQPVLYVKTETGNQITADIRNNIFINGHDTNTDVGGYYYETGVTITSDNNYAGTRTYASRVIGTNPGGEVVETKGVKGGDPLFVAAYTDCINNTCDFRLQATSPLASAGADLTSVWSGTPTDKNGNGRGSAWSIGAYDKASAPVINYAPWVR